MKEAFDTLNVITEQIHKNARSKGFWDDAHEKLFVPTKLALIHSEVSEALEAWREDDEANLGEELADIVIRTLDLAWGLGFNIGSQVMLKMEQNTKRPHMHGKRA